MLFYVDDFEQISDSYCRTKVCEMYIFLVKLFSWFLFLLLEGQFCPYISCVFWEIVIFAIVIIVAHSIFLLAREMGSVIILLI
jgi:hypothetical protein